MPKKKVSRVAFFTERLCSRFFFLGTALIGLLCFRDYGVSADEPSVKSYGEQVWHYLFDHGPVPPVLDWTLYGPAWPLFLKALNDLFGVEYVKTFWELRHGLTFALFFVGLIFFYDLSKRLLKDWRFALLGTAFLLLSPRVFAHAFYNPKDIPAMVFFIVCMDTMLIFLERKTIVWLLIHSILCGLLISMRLPGALIPALTVLFLLAEKRNHKNLLFAIASVGVSTGSLILFWPFLWHSPFTHFLEALHASGGRLVGGLYFGKLVGGSLLSTNLWHYVPVWITITTPLLYITLFLVGCTVSISRIVRKKKRSLPPAELIPLLWFFCPLIALYGLNAGIFDEWRHLLFLYPALILLAIMGAEWLWTVTKKTQWQKGVAGVIGLSLLSTSLWMIRWHPFEYAYFSVPASWVDGKFELDYWSLSYRAGWEWILKHDDRQKIFVYARTTIGEKGGETLPHSQTKRLFFVPIEYADYMLDNFRDDGYQKLAPADYKAHSITVDGVEILGIYYGPHSRVDPNHHNPPAIDIIPDTPQD